MKTISLIFLIISFVFIGCEKGSESINPVDDELIGSWINPVYSDSLITLQRTNGLPENQYAISFMQEQICIEKKNVGWCGTPPISYGDYEGTWIRNDSIVNLDVGFWGGHVQSQWKILSLNNDELIVWVQHQEYIDEE